MKSWSTTNGIQISRLLGGRSNCYFVAFGKMKILVDTAGKNRFSLLKKRLELKLGPEKLDYLFLTHTHFDHVQNAARLKKIFGCKIIADERESEFLSKGSTPLPKGSFALTKFITWLGKRLTNIDRYPEVKCDICVDDIYEIKTRTDPIRMLRTPGHSAGSLTLVLDDEIALVVDSMYWYRKNSVFPVFADNKRGVIESWQKMLKTNCTLFLTGHGKPIPREILEKNFLRLNPN